MEPDTSFWLEIDGTFSDDAGSGGETITFTFPAKAITITPPAKPVASLTIDKSAPGGYDAENNIIDWKVTVTANNGDFSGVSVVDTWSENQDYKEDSFRIGGENPGEDDLTVNNGKHTFTYTFPGKIGKGETKTLTYQTQPTDGAFTTGEKQVTFNNGAALRQDDVDKDSDAASVDVDLDWITKTSTGVHITDSVKEIDWKVEAGIDGRTVSNAKISDTLPAGLALKDDDNVDVQWQAPGSTEPVALTLSSNDDPDPGQYSYDADTRECVFNVSNNGGKLTGRGTLTYTTTVTDPDTDLNDNGEKTYSNTATLTWDELTVGTGPSDSADGTVGSGGLISKWADGTKDFDYYHPVIHWTIVVNRNKISMPANTQVSDVIPTGQTFVDGTFKVYKNEDFSIPVTPGTLSGPSTEADGTHITYTFSNVFSDTYTIKYDTEITDFDAFYAGTGNGGTDVKIYNQVSLIRGEDTITIDPDPSKTLNSQVLEKSVAEHYDYSTHEVTWEIVVNRNKLPMTNATVTDTIPDGMEYVDGTFYVDGTLTAPSTVSDDLRTVSYQFENINEQHVITLTTKLTDEKLKEQFNNGTDFTNQAALTTTDHGPFTDSATVNINNPILTKDTENYEKGDGYIEWAVSVNQGQLALGGNATLTDPLDSCLVLDQSSVKVYKANVNPANGTLTPAGDPLSSPDDYTVDYQTVPGENFNHVTFTFKNPGNSAYLVKFTTDIDMDLIEQLPGKTKTFTNSAELTGIAGINGGTQNSTNVEVTSARGGANNNVGTVTVHKTDEAGNPLEGAVFALLNYKGTKEIATATTDEQGIATFSKQSFYAYHLVEKTPPAGYLKDTTDKLFRLSNDAKTFEWTFQDKKIAPGTVSFQKKSTGGALLSGGSFQLTGTSGGGQTVTRTASSAGGTVTFKDVPIGTYTISEITPPSGYRATSQTLTATVRVNAENTAVESVVTPDTMTDERRSGGGGNGGGGGGNVPGDGSYSVSVTKTDESGKRLAGAEFTLYGPNGTVLAKAVSNEQGVALFDRVAEGAYTIRETRAPEGYELNAQSIGAVVNDSTTNAFTVADRKKTVSPGSITVRKTDLNGKTLAGAELTLYDADGKFVQKLKSGADGLAVFENLAPGKYSVKETAAPAGFSLYGEALNVALASGQKYSVALRNRPAGGPAAENVGWEETPHAGPTPDAGGSRKTPGGSGGSLPKTGGIPAAAILLAAGALLVFAGAAVRMRTGKHFAAQRIRIRNFFRK